MLNTYGPTETTVTATWTELTPDKPVTIGRPLPTYSVHILDAAAAGTFRWAKSAKSASAARAWRGYVKRPDLTAAKFIADPFQPHVPRRKALSHRRPGPDHARRRDRISRPHRHQVKIRGHRIELAEIESVLMEDAALQNAVVVKVSARDGR